MSALEAAPGQPINWPDAGQEQVLAKCDDKSAPGQWCCLTHKEWFPHNFAMQSHTNDATDHVIAWRCTSHGIEQP